MTQQPLINDLLTPIGAFIRLQEFNPVFLFETVTRQGSAGRYSFIGLDPMETITFEKSQGPDLLSQLRKSLASLPSKTAVERRVPAGLVGYTGFEALSGSNQTDNDGIPEAAFVVPRIVLALDHVSHSMTIEQIDREEPEPALVRGIIEALRSGTVELGDIDAASGQAQPTSTRKELVERIAAVRKKIAAGELYQTTLSAGFRGETEIHPFRLYRALRHLYPSPYLYFLRVGDIDVLGSSPERLLRCENDMVSALPLSGLMPISSNGASARSAEAFLAGDRTERNKHAVLVDALHDQFARVCSPGSIALKRFREIERTNHEVHLLSEITGRLAEDCDAFDAFGAVFPAGTVSGFPKQAALETIANLEGEPRRMYGGTVGYFSTNKTMDHAIAVRAMTIRNGRYSARSGAIVTANADPHLLAERIHANGQAVLRILDIARECL